MKKVERKNWLRDADYGLKQPTVISMERSDEKSFFVVRHGGTEGQSRSAFTRA